MLGCATGRICCRCHILLSSCLTWVIGLAATIALVHMMLDFIVKDLSIASTQSGISSGSSASGIADRATSEA